MRLLNGLVTLSSSVPGIPGPGFAEDVYGLRRFDRFDHPAKEAQAAGGWAAKKWIKPLYIFVYY